MPHIEFEGRKIEIDNDKFLIDPGDWNDELAVLFAKDDGIEFLTETHWIIIRFIRKYFDEHGKAPMARILCGETSVSLKELFILFPLGPARGACRVAGLPKPEGCV